jgi:predicted N-acetyltransferase YhbS
MKDNTMPCIIREITQRDYSYIAEIIRNDLGYRNSSDSDVAIRLKKITNHNDYITFVAEYANKVVGFIGLIRGIAYEINGEYVRIAALAIKQEYQNLGIGSKLLEEAENYTRKVNAETIVLNSGIQRVKAHEFYEKRGYIKKGYSFRKELK